MNEDDAATADAPEWSTDDEKTLATALTHALADMADVRRRWAAADEGRDAVLRGQIARMAKACLGLEDVEELARELERHAASLRGLKRMLDSCKPAGSSAPTA